jgi:hypothetical protein
MGKQETNSKKVEQERMMPALHQDQYYVSPDKKNLLTSEDKAEFLKLYYKTGNQTKSIGVLGKNISSIRWALEKDPVFALDFDHVKQAIKHDLEETMLTNALSPRGYMDRITWLRTNYPNEYNPNAVKGDDDKSKDAIKLLSAKLDEYELIPKKKIVEQE